MPDAAVAVDAGNPTADAPPQADAAPPAAMRVIGYFTSWSGDVNSVHFEWLTHVNYAFILPTASGGLTGDTGSLDSVVSRAHAKGVKVFISVGGWNNGDDSAFEKIAVNAGLRATFVNNLVKFVADHDLDGADIDWEYPDAGASAQGYTALMKELAAKLHPQGKLVTAAVVGEGSQGSGITAESFEYVDFLNIMAYDAGTPHSTYDYAVKCLNYWRGRGLPQEKTVLGVPFYGREPYKSYRDIVADDPSAPQKDQVGNIHYNGIPTIKKKTALAKKEASGIMNWEMSQDTTDNTSLLRAIHEAVLAP